MIRLDIKLEQKHEMFCFEAVIASVAVWLKRRYEMIFSQYWDFKLTGEDPVYPGFIGRRISVESGDQLPPLEQYHGIRITFHNIPKFKEVLKLANRNLEAGLPIVAWINYDRVPEIPKNIRLSESYPFIILGVDDVKQGVYCLDAHFLKKPIFLSYKNFSRGYSMCISFSTVHDEIKEFNWREIIHQNTNRLLENNSFDSMRDLSRLIPGAFHNPMEISGKKDIPEIIEKLKVTYRSRILFSDFLAYLIKFHRMSGLSEYQERLVKIANQWYLAWGCLGKANLQMNLSFSRDFDSLLSQVSNKIYKNANDEEELCNLFIETLDHLRETPERAPGSESITVPAVAARSFDTLHDFRFVDLGGFLNNEGFAVKMDSNHTASLSTGQFLLAEGLPPEDVWDIEGIKFHFPAPMDGAPDNLVCEGQTIHCPPDNYQTIFLLGCAEWGHQSETLEVFYGDGSSAALPLEITDWSYQDPFFGEKLAWEGPCALRYNNEVNEIPWFKGHLFAQAIPLDSKLQLMKIHLPDCVNIHLFAISFGK